ncbi:MAG TPA: exopolyphosphatase [Edaphocola sp.]|nr:exopolyphosphatase [Edaphocola sp.]
MILAAIDIGSNATRLLIMQVEQYQGGQIDYTKLNFLRIPLRLGTEVFTSGYISEVKTRALTNTMKIYASLMKLYKVTGYRACATSAMRDAKNGAEIASALKKDSGIDIQIISGSEEADIIYQTHIADNMNPARSYLYIDVGGGSTELILFSKGKITFKESFNIGTLRLLNHGVSDKQWKSLKSFIKMQTKGLGDLKAIGSGGNINKIQSLSKLKEEKLMSSELLNTYYEELRNLSTPERMHFYHLRRDRADVIVPALRIYTSVLRWADISEIYIPKIGLADGLIRMLFSEQK